ncbi:MAG: polysaccharide deacetylase family protein [Mesorhizobium sp.]
MSSDDVWQPLLRALDRWNRAGRRAEFWLRDDDAIEPTEPLDRLLDLTARFEVPVMLAVIPAFTGEPLAHRLAEAPYASIAVHGWSHQNHAPAGEKKQELGAHRPREVVLGELSRGLSLLADLHQKRALPILVPPWNRIDDGLIAELPRLGFTALSVYGPAKPASIKMINTDVDLMDWHGTRGCRAHADLVRDVVAQLDESFDGANRTVGLLCHHLVHDEQAWAFLERLFEITSRRGSRWRSAAGLMDPGKAIGA